MNILLQQGLEWWKGLEQKAKAITAIVAVIVGIAALPLWLETRYATAEDMRTQVGGIKQLYLRSERRSLQKELFEYEVKARKAPLTDLERQRVWQLKEELKEIDEELKTLKK